MAMFDKQKSSKQPPLKKDEPVVGRQAADKGSTPATGAPAKVAMVGEGIIVSGDVAAANNLKVEGRIEGRSVTSSQDVEIGASGVVLASITAKVVRIAGTVSGDVSGSEKVVISKSGRVQGNIVAPRVQLDDGALFRGSIDMNPEKTAPAKPAAKPQQAAQSAPAGNKSGGPEVRKEQGLTLKSG